MMFTTVKTWLQKKWKFDAKPDELLQHYRSTFLSASGDFVLQDLMDKFYCTVAETDNPIELATHNGARTVIHRILQNLDASEHKEKYQGIQVIGEDNGAGITAVRN